MPLFDKPAPLPGRTLWDRFLYGLCALVIWAAVLWSALSPDKEEPAHLSVDRPKVFQNASPQNERRSVSPIVRGVPTE